LEKPLHPTQGVVAQAMVFVVSIILFILAIVLDERWLHRHFLPEFFQSRDEQLGWLMSARLALAAVGVLLISVRPRIGRWAAAKSGRELALSVLPTLLAVVLALGVSELLLRRLPWFADHQLPAQREPIRRADPVLGWTYAENRVGRGVLGGRMIEYVFDPAGHRVRKAGERVDYAAPSLLFVGESIICGHGVTYDESIPGRAGARLGLQSADLAVGGYATDQMYLRLRAEWPRYVQPRAVVILFMPSLFHRNLGRDRPHLDPSLRWRPPSDRSRLLQIVDRLVPYRTDRDVADGVLMTRRALAGMVAMARARGAVPLILVPEFAPETTEETRIRTRVLRGLPYLRVAVNPAWHLANNRHPDARADAVLADAVAAYIETHPAHAAAPPAAAPAAPL
jgi:hypothetical protein